MNKHDISGFCRCDGGVASANRRARRLRAAAFVIAALLGFAVCDAPLLNAQSESIATERTKSRPPAKPEPPAIRPDDFTSFKNAELAGFAKLRCFGEYEKLRDMENKTIEIKLNIRRAQEIGHPEAEARETKRLEAYRAEAGKIRKAIRNKFFDEDEKPTTHAVVRGERLSTIAKKLGCTKAALVAANPGVTDATLKVGQTLKVPGSARVATAPRDEDDEVFIPGEKTTYEVCPDDYSAAKIAAKLGCTEAALRAANPGVNFSALSRGELLNIPKGGS